MIKKIVIGFTVTIAILFIAFILYMIFVVKAGPINTDKNNSVEVSGVISKVYEGGVKDLVFNLKNDDNIYYINRGLEDKFDLNLIASELLNQEITLWYAKRRSGPGGHMMQLMVKDSIYYTEWQEPLPRKNVLN